MVVLADLSEALNDVRTPLFYSGHGTVIAVNDDVVAKVYHGGSKDGIIMCGGSSECNAIREFSFGRHLWSEGVSVPHMYDILPAGTKLPGLTTDAWIVLMQRIKGGDSEWYPTGMFSPGSFSTMWDQELAKAMALGYVPFDAQRRSHCMWEDGKVYLIDFCNWIKQGECWLPSWRDMDQVPTRTLSERVAKYRLP